MKTTLYNAWLACLQGVLPLFLLVHGLFALLTCFSFLFRLQKFSTTHFPLHALLDAWDRWDTGHYLAIAQHGYDGAWRTAFFPLYPLLMHLFLPHPLVAGLLISSGANFIVLTVLSRLVCDELGQECAHRTVLYLSLFPAAFFLVAAYTESLFLCFVVLSFSALRHHHLLLAGLFGFLASLTRSTGMFLILPIAYVYFFEQEKWRAFSVLGIALVPCGLVAYACYCSMRFGDALSWYHAQALWQHQFHLPWETLWITVRAIRHASGLFSYQALHDGLDLLSVLFVLVMAGLMCVKPFRLPPVYLVYALPLIFFFLCAPVINIPLVPLQSVPRFMLEVFPVFVVASALGKYRVFHEGYMFISGALLSLSCLLFLIGHWMV